MHVATRGMDAFMEVLEKNASLTDLVSLTLDILDCTLTEAGGDDDDPQQISADDEIGDRLAELMLQRANFMASLVKLLACNDFAVRRFVKRFFRFFGVFLGSKDLRHISCEQIKIYLSQ